MRAKRIEQPRAKIFISYRRSDGEFIVDQVSDFLEDYFGEGSVFRDIDDTPLASDFETVLDENLALADVLIVVVTEGWLGINSETQTRRIDNPQDYVRHEIRFGLQRKIPIVPFVIHPASMPNAEALPEDIREFHRRQAQAAYPGNGFGVSMLQLVEGLFSILPAVDHRRKRDFLEDTQVIGSKRAQREARKKRHLQQSMRKLTAAYALLSLLLVILAVAIGYGVFRVLGSTPPFEATISESDRQASKQIAATWTEADQLRLQKEIASLQSRRPAPRRTRLENHRFEASLGFPDYSAFEILSDDRYWDLRGWQQIETESDSCFVILTRRVRLLKVAPASEIRFEVKTDGEDVFVECISNPAGAKELVASNPAFVGDRSTKLRQLVVNVEHLPVNEEVTIEYRATYWNSLQDPNDRWLGAIGYPRADRLRVYVLLPDNLPLKGYHLRMAPSYRDESRDYDGPLRILEAQDNSSLLWEVPTPQGNWVYTLLLDW